MKNYFFAFFDAIDYHTMPALLKFPKTFFLDKNMYAIVIVLAFFIK